MNQDARASSILAAPVALWAVLILILASSVATLLIGRLLFGGDDAEGQTLVQQSEPNEIEVDWREGEYGRIAQLRGGLSIERFRQLLGVPMFVTPSKDGQFTEYLFRRRDYWVQAVADMSGSVALMSVTSCDKDFQPSIADFGGPNPIVLNQTHFQQAGLNPTRLRYFTSAATSNSYYYDEYYLGNLGKYKTYFVGINDACRFEVPNDLRLPFMAQIPQWGDQAVHAFRANAVANTYGETGVFFDERVLESFQIGATRILVRTAPPYPAAR